jgi:hypothetical protein
MQCGVWAVSMGDACGRTRITVSLPRFSGFRYASAAIDPIVKPSLHGSPYSGPEVELAEIEVLDD